MCLTARWLAELVRFSVVDSSATGDAVPAALGALLELPALMFVSIDLALDPSDELLRRHDVLPSLLLATLCWLFMSAGMSRQSSAVVRYFSELSRGGG